MEAVVGALQTHVSQLFFTAGHVYKIKRPVAFGFVDLTSLPARQEACRAEVELNRRLAPDVYEGVGTFIGPDGTPEPVVVMRRLPDGLRLSRLAREGYQDADAELVRVAQTLAGFHATAIRGPEVDADCGVEAVTRLWRANLEELRTVAVGCVGPAPIAEAEELALRYLSGRGPLLEERLAGGHAVDGHGDLLADDVFCLEDGPRLLDCLEFDTRLRHCDTLSDVASLASDLERLGRPDLAVVLLDAYRLGSGDRWPASLADLYIAYRATVRTKVACIRLREGDATAAPEARRLMDIAVTHLRTAIPRLVVVGGLPGTGKSTLAMGIRSRTGWTLLRSDELRRRTDAGRAADAEGGPRGHAGYTAEDRGRVYGGMLDRAGRLLGRGESVVLDATWGHQEWRTAAADLAEQWAADLSTLCCVAPEVTAAGRIERRRMAGADPSEATSAVVAGLRADWDPWPDATVIDTTGPVGRALDAAMRALGAGERPPGARA